MPFAQVRGAFSLSLFRCVVVLAMLATVQVEADEGTDFQVNAYTAGDQKFPSTAMAPDGSFAIVWQSQGSPGTDSSGTSILGRRYDAGGEPAATGPFQVNTYTTGNQGYPAIAMDPDGSFVVVWESAGSPGSDDSSYSIQAQRFEAAGTPLGSQFQINSVTAGMQGRPRIAMGADKRFVVVWESPTAQDLSGAIEGRVFAANGSPMTAETTLNTTTQTVQFDPDVAMAPSGDWLAVWTTFEPNPQFANIAARFVDRFGVADPAEFQVNSYTFYLQSLASVAAGPSGDFVVVWQSDLAPEDPSLGAVRGQRISATSQLTAGEFQVNSTTLNYQTYPDVAFNQSDDFLVVWTSGHDSDHPVMAQRYVASGERDGGEFQISQLPTSYEAASLSAGTGDAFVVSWHSPSSLGSDSSGKGIQAHFRKTVLFRDTFETALFGGWNLVQ